MRCKKKKREGKGRAGQGRVGAKFLRNSMRCKKRSHELFCFNKQADGTVRFMHRKVFI